jgi:5-formaminoimidazole-4-carboxamide-1-beta-D-ribofuranosyl 5'-monophosphate synthetase
MTKGAFLADEEGFEGNIVCQRLRQILYEHFTVISDNQRTLCTLDSGEEWQNAWSLRRSLTRRLISSQDG